MLMAKVIQKPNGLYAPGKLCAFLQQCSLAQSMKKADSYGYKSCVPASSEEKST